MTDHSPEPWRVSLSGTRNEPIIIAANGTVLMEAMDDPPIGPENLRRVVVCVNSCQGYETKDLELFGKERPKKPDERFLELLRQAYRAMYSQQKHLDPENSGQTEHSNDALNRMVEAFRLVGATL